MFNRIGCALLATTSLLVACGDDEEIGSSFDDRQLVTDYADKVVIPTYQLLASRLEALHESVQELVAEPSPANLDAARQAWIEARVPWEQSEAFLFGPVDFNGYDPALDSWPLNKNDLDAVLASNAEFTPTFVASLQETQKGFHTVEYLLFGVNRAKTADSLTSRELAYLEAIANEMKEIGAALAASWTTSVDGQPAYRDVFVTAGEAGNSAFPSLVSAAQQIVEGMSTICDEVANGKIADPYDAHDTTLVESQFAWNSIADFQDNLRGVQNVYLGSMPLAGTSGRGLSDWVAERDPELDARVKAEIEAAIEAIGAIPAPFRDAINDPAAYAAIEAAQEAVRHVQNTLERDVLALLNR